ncbi:type III secretion system inner membrane ring lipoprotein SctJ [Ensifer sp. SL37]|uniref:type III secretion system inner membrane ring lipoprotein SctJ n=1 Tax=Ensifer sp. SL37 TaxID=2995137 RepID=UPI002272E783|nr:type III secretion inner membrane ring lipoprotein SctJ [Ensifer sp. SL37]MCY1740496.1 type III secretion inner membrane ring lipoprotein SctJ [Ensifer sp. SL37]
MKTARQKAPGRLNGRSLSGAKFALLLSALLTMSGCKVDLHAGIEESEANEMLAMLLANDISASKQQEKDNKSTLLVDEAQFGKAVELLKRAGLPRRKFAKMGDVFSADGLISSPLQEWARFNFALTEELSATISSIPGVVSADVHVVTSRKDTPFSEPIPPSASVLVLIARDAITAELVPQIKQLVAFSVQGVEYDRVAVVVSAVDPLPIVNPELIDVAGIALRSSSFNRAMLAVTAASLLSAVCAALGVTFFFRARNTRKTA